MLIITAGAMDISEVDGGRRKDLGELGDVGQMASKGRILRTSNWLQILPSFPDTKPRETQTTLV
jgi:hypothetical protein